MSSLPIQWPKSFQPVPYNLEVSRENEQDFNQIAQPILDNYNLYNHLPLEYSSCPAARILIIALIIIGISVSVMITKHTLMSFPQNFMNFVQQINWVYVGGGAAVLTVWTIGAAIVIHRVIHKPRFPITHQGIGKLHGDNHWVPAIYVRKGDDKYIFSGYIDTSTLQDKNGKAFMYVNKTLENHYVVALELIALSPLYMLGSIGWNLLRLLVAPFYIGGKLLSYKWLGEPQNQAERFQLSDITDQMCIAVVRMVQALFFALAILFCAVYALIDPLNGHKLIHYVEWEWNQGKTRAQSWWSVGGPQELFEWRECFSKEKFFEIIFTGPGCLHPIAVAHFEEEKIVPEKGESLSLATSQDPTKGRSYLIYTPEALAAFHNEQVKKLIQQYAPSYLD